MKTEPKALFFAILTIIIASFVGHLFRPVVNISKAIVNQTPVFALKNDNGRTNVLILGTGGAGHDGPNLTDTIIVASATASGNITMISVPRDIYLDSLQSKINGAYQIGLDRGAGLTTAEQAISEVTGLPIQYAIRVDFKAFERVIDILDGIDINVPTVLDDYHYPIDGKEEDVCGYSPQDVATISATIIDDQTAFAAFPCRYTHLHIDAGWQHMDGKTALEYVRSRHAEGDEGTDFARSRRQQLVIKAVRDKIISTDNLLNPLKLKAIYDELKNDVDTNFDLSNLDQLIILGLKYKNSDIKNVYLDLNLLTNPPADYRGWVLLPKGGTWDQVHQYIKSQL